jgi:ribosomal protein S18 acetylase RimI-like enzyme
LIRIRSANQGDATAIAALHAQSWRIAYRGILSDQYLQHDLDQDRCTDWQKRFANPEPNQYVIVAEDSDAPTELLGFACAYGQFDIEVGTLIENLHAHPQRKKSGIGRMLLRHIAQWSLDRYPDDAMHLWVLEQNTAAIGFYQHLGAVEDMQSIWDAPGGTEVPEFRYTWYKPAQLLER